jgi:DNA-binding response OmpR family regulator
MARLLVVDDEENQAKVLAMGLRLEGFDVVSAADAGTARRHLEGGPVDLAIIDLMMPGTNGIELARVIRAEFPATRVILMSAFHLSQRQLERAECGAIGFVPKPYMLDDLVAFVNAKLACGPTSVRVLETSRPPSRARTLS